MGHFLLGRAKSFVYALEGIAYVFRTQKNAQVHLFVIVVVNLMAIWLQLSGIEFAIIYLAIGVVLAAEFFNTAAETLVDLVSPGLHPLAKIIKDVCAGGVLICSICAVVVGVFLMGPPLLARLAQLFG